ncbi:hypothetical protein PC129_g23173 [Phytophthora cactorum]|uniref:Uncharacterized protein n=1 Tax=Phytophthora cactorum TaxID=29920 RepID=A0A8T1AEM9_9STRA|nr:hypothetical protein PC111_g22273 [Phytophthora cactorum]KAG2798408.1 hypothetical protein PC112_g21363 [Phytophthora cactorum]KAG2872510.1 hypothetical protein PC114_g26341 [Phytophthora cactorum]KAG2877150.1 hypothetical protein PC115_g23431 [Phytophthora cactorum]KAG2961562.1 hypothetical protein PC118_g21905 [Phytophthora cactorum]
MMVEELKDREDKTKIRQSVQRVSVDVKKRGLVWLNGGGARRLRMSMTGAAGHGEMRTVPYTERAVW